MEHNIKTKSFGGSLVTENWQDNLLHGVSVRQNDKGTITEINYFDHGAHHGTASFVLNATQKLMNLFNEAALAFGLDKRPRQQIAQGQITKLDKFFGKKYANIALTKQQPPAV